MHLLALVVLAQLGSSPLAELAARSPADTLTTPRLVTPVLWFPDPALDDPAAYLGYRTRFFRDAAGNTLQIYLDARSGRAVHLWADAANESIGFTARDSAGRAVALDWGSDTAAVADSAGMRLVAYRLKAQPALLRIGWFLLGSMRVERDLQYAERHLEPFGAPPMRLPEVDALIEALERLDSNERGRQLQLLGARNVQELRERLRPTIGVRRAGSTQMLHVEQQTLDGRNQLALSVAVDSRRAVISLDGGTATIRSRSRLPIELTVTVASDAVPLTPLDRDEIFTPEFLRFVSRARAAHDSVLRHAGARRLAPAESAVVTRSRRLERQVRSVELLSSREKLMAGLPNFATYFGRDMMMSALMMQSIWAPAMSEHVIASVLRKLSPTGQVSHEEALGGQAIRENAAEYARLMSEYSRVGAGAAQARDSLLDSARTVLGDLQAVRENYNMRDDEFQLPVLAARYLRDRGTPAERKRAFLLTESHGGQSRLTLLLRELSLVASIAAPYLREPVAGNLVAFPLRDSVHYFPGSWRDSNAGYANGRFAMDINAIWVPHALTAIGEILESLEAIGIERGAVERELREERDETLLGFLRDRTALQRAELIWSGASRHFIVALSSAEIQDRVTAWLRWLPEEERRHWERMLASTPAARDSLVFLALSLDASGRPIPVANTDVATALFLAGRTAPTGRGTIRREDVLRVVDVITRPYPVGLSIDRVGPVVANDAYASLAVWEAFRQDAYHSPRVVWGREVNLFLLGLANQIGSAADAPGPAGDPTQETYRQTLGEALRRTMAAVEASGFKHAELWSYRIENGRLMPARYGTSSDVQLWSTTDLAVQFALERLGLQP